MLRINIATVILCALTLDVCIAQDGAGQIPNITGYGLGKPFDLFNLSTPTNSTSQSHNTSRMEIELPTVTVSGAQKPVPVGELIALTANIDNKPINLHSVSYSWTILPQRETLIWPDGTKAVFGTGTNTPNYTVILTASFVFITKDGDKILDIAQKTSTQSIIVKIDNTAPTKPTNPETPVQPPTDKPNIPEGPTSPTNPTTPTEPVDTELTGLAKLACDWTNLVIRNDSNQDEDIKIDANSLSKSFINIAALIDNGTYNDVHSIMNATKTSNDSVIKHKIEWLPWFAKMSEHLQNSFKEGSIREPEQFSKAWKEIAKGLEYIGN